MDLTMMPLTPAIIGTAMLGLGLCRLSAPRQAYGLFGLPLATSTPPSPFVYANAGRDLALGVAFLLLGLQRNQEGLKALLVATAITAQVDAWTVWVHGGAEYGGWKGKWAGHAVGGVMLAFVAWQGWGI